MLRKEGVLLPRSLVGPSVTDSQETRVRHTSGEGQGAADVFDSRSLDGQAVGSDVPQLSPPGASLGLPACRAHLGSEPPFFLPCVEGSHSVVPGRRQEGRRSCNLLSIQLLS